jgi:hypothetical protein
MFEGNQLHPYDLSAILQLVVLASFTLTLFHVHLHELVLLQHTHPVPVSG